MVLRGWGLGALLRNKLRKTGSFSRKNTPFDTWKLTSGKGLNWPLFIGFQRCIKIHINIDSLPVRPGAPPSLYPFFLPRQKGGDLTQSYDKSPYTHGNVKRAVTTQTTSQKSSIKQRLWTDLGRSVGVTTATQLVWLTWFTGPTFPLPATAV